MKNCVTINLKTDKIIVKIDESSEQKEIIEALNKKLKDLKKLYKDETTPIYIVGKVMKNKEMEELQAIIKKEIDVNIDFESPKELGLIGIKKVFSKEIISSETKFYKGSLRSGQKLEFEGSIVLLGDVNSGAEVIASENIVILGILRGLAHAGAKGNAKAIIAANKIDCPQIRISNVIKEIENDEDAKKYAYVDGTNNVIILE